MIGLFAFFRRDFFYLWPKRRKKTLVSFNLADNFLPFASELD